jgi:RimJ/RimL family protein N-acetyltransferase
VEKANVTVLEGNDASRRCAEASGYLAEGKQRAQFFKNGIRIDALLMGLTREDWESRTDDQI